MNHEDHLPRKEVLIMCYECGCGSTTTVMSDDSITTDKTFVPAAKALLQGGKAKTMQDAILLAKENTYKLLKKELGEK